MQKAVIFLSAMLIIMGCQPMSENSFSGKIDMYDIKELLVEMPGRIYSSNPVFIKSATINDQEDSTSMMLDSVGWISELLFITESKVDNARLMSRYNYTSQLIDGDSIVNFKAIDPKTEDIDALQVVFRDQIPSSMEMDINTYNSLYSTSETLQLSFINAEDDPMLSSYSLKGWQLMKTKDTTFIKLQASLIY